MADAREVLEMMKKVAQIRIDMLKEGITYHDNAKRNAYLQAYEEKLGEINTMLRRLNLRLVHSKPASPPSPEA